MRDEQGGQWVGRGSHKVEKSTGKMRQYKFGLTSERTIAFDKKDQ